MGTRHVGMRPQMMRSLQHTRPFHLSQSRWNDKAEEAKEGEADKAEEKAEAKEEKKEEKKEKTPEEIIKEKDAEIADMKNKYMTSLAEMQNLRTRTQKDVSSAKKYVHVFRIYMQTRFFTQSLHLACKPTNGLT